MGLERYVEPFVYQTKVGKTSLDPALGLSWEQCFERLS
jgi:hypothetical protein